MPNSDPWDRFVHPYLTLMSGSYNIEERIWFEMLSESAALVARTSNLVDHLGRVVDNISG